MFKKINYIRGYSKFANHDSNSAGSYGALGRVTVIYAPNGSGKTSLSVMFRSMKGDNSLVSKKRSFHSSVAPEILLIRNDGKEQKYAKGKWNRRIDEIEIFDSYYIEDNIYLITVDTDPNQMNIFELSMKDQVLALVQKRAILQAESQRLTTQRKNIKGRIKATGSTIEKKQHLEDVVGKRNEINKEIAQIDAKRLDITERQRKYFLDRINTYLTCFSRDICLTQLTPKSKRIIYNIKIDGQHIKMDEDERYSLKYALSEGDKNALALSFFLARLDLIPNIKDYLIVIDDPFTSFDHHRKQTTISNLTRLAGKVGQFILLTHDLQFANDFTEKQIERPSVLQLKVTPRGSVIGSFDIKKATLTGIFKDMSALNLFVRDGADSESKLREIVRCIRPVIEGIFRIKYFGLVEDTQWLGDFIRMIRESDVTSPFSKLSDVVDEISEINDYSKTYHHSNPEYMEEPINPKEIEIYVKRTIGLVRRI